MYRQRFGFIGHPLPKDAHGKTFFDQGPGYKKLERAFRQLVADPGLGVLTADAGVGKTAAIRNLCAQLPKPDPLSAHRHQGEQRDPALLVECEHVDAVAHAARLEQQHPAFAAEPGPRQHGHPFLLGGERHRVHLSVGVAALDEPVVAGVGYVRDLPDARGLELGEDIVGPGERHEPREV